MTDYDAMTDEELAVLVAEKVMGWAWDGDLSAWVSVIDEGGDVRWHCDRLTWAPATQWNDAGLVLEKMAELGWCGMVEVNPTGKQAFAEFAWPESTLRDTPSLRERVWKCGTAHADSPCRAICIAALRAVEQEARP